MSCRNTTPDPLVPDKLEQYEDGSTHESYLGDSFFVRSPVIDP
jgi:hypothetical protein